MFDFLLELWYVLIKQPFDIIREKHSTTLVQCRKCMEYKLQRDLVWIDGYPVCAKIKH